MKFRRKLNFYIKIDKKFSVGYRQSVVCVVWRQFFDQCRLKVVDTLCKLAA